MRTTLGRSALATAENADERMRASLGISVRGVTGPPACGCGGDGALGAGADGAVAGAALSAGACSR